MSGYEYKVIPAPTKGQKVKGARTSAERFAHVLQAAMNELGAEGWEYQRADTLPSEEREGLMGKTTVYQNMLVFRRPRPAAPEITDAPAAPEPLAIAAPPVVLENAAPKTPEPAPAPKAPKPGQATDATIVPTELAPAPPINTVPGQSRIDQS